MTVTVTPTEDALFDKLGTFVAFILPTGVEVVKGLGNRVPPPAGPHVAVTATLQRRLGTNEAAYTDTGDPGPVQGFRAVTTSMEMAVQLDFYGPDAGAWAAAAVALWRDDQGCELLGPECQPLYADEGFQAPFVTGEEQYEARWIVNARLQYNPTIELSQQFADAAEVTAVNVDVQYPP
jgi:hypothetical protein